LRKSITSIIILVSVIACSSTPNYQSVNRGEAFSLVKSGPELRATAQGLYNLDDEPYIDYGVDIIYGSLNYVKLDDKYTAKYRLLTEIIDKETDAVVYSNVGSHKISDSHPALRNFRGIFSIPKNIAISSGSYLLNTTVTDEWNNESNTVSNDIFIPSANDGKPHLTEVIMLGKNDNGLNFRRVSSYELAGSADSLLFQFQVYNPDGNKQFVVTSELQSLASDNSIARPTFFPDYDNSSLEFRGIDYRRTTNIQRFRRIVSQEGSILVEYVVPKLTEGNYRFSVSIADDANQKIYKSRDFAVRSENYPLVVSAEERRAPLKYIMFDREYNNLLQLASEDEIIAAIDSFWLNAGGTSERAEQLSSLFYERVETANRAFGDVKEGWKTDMGMVYIMNGEPEKAITFQNAIQWVYNDNYGGPLQSPVFMKIKPYEADSEYSHHVLMRGALDVSFGPALFLSARFNELSTIQAWRSGIVLDRPLIQDWDNSPSGKISLSPINPGLIGIGGGYNN
jgi:GWxTD domain-containing protein